MKIQDMINILIWLIEFMEKYKPAEFDALKYRDMRWDKFDRKKSVRDWIIEYANTKKEARQRIEDILRALKMLTFRDYSSSSELKKNALWAIVRLGGAAQHNEECSRKDLEDKITGFVEASA